MLLRTYVDLTSEHRNEMIRRSRHLINLDLFSCKTTQSICNYNFLNLNNPVVSTVSHPFQRNYSSSYDGVGAGEEKIGDIKEVRPEDKRIFSGIQPTGQIHLGNYFGAIKQWVKFQEEKVEGKYGECIYSVVDLHAITMPQERDSLEKSTFECVATLLACGIDPNKSILFLQSHVALHSQLSWVLGCTTTMPRLGQLPQFKEKSKTLAEVPLGLFTYPVLQSADILLYKSTHIPIGEDNFQHVQLAQHTAHRFNRIYGDTFTMPKAIMETGMWSRLRSLRKPENKMSKSEPDARSRISLMESPDEIVSKVKKAVTDFTSEVTFDPEKRPGVANLITIHSLCTGESPEEICSQAQARGLDTGKYKLVVAEALVEYLKPIRERLLDLMEDRGYLLSVLQLGAEKATEIGQPTWDKACYNVGISPQLSWLSQQKRKVKKSVSSAT
ncbi:tryptophan--tRNA ligase, mitochondrial [Folsomia candida]|uniref:Tryptophan--tRNA ligase, mitochondrial n=1 Tax=Folsomia candida TaxID=158441 RepID=A0A226DZL6_FOLCA|nr:tryptophan--tRNA ligase, mitochondrial [Folsomia candida]OXA50167.1 Tryptophan--tRNA ligase, mitochondrial [Folsomia candida]